VRAINDRRKIVIGDHDAPLWGYGFSAIGEYLDAAIVIEIVKHALDNVAVASGRNRLEEVSCHHFGPAPEASVAEACCPFQHLRLLE